MRETISAPGSRIEEDEAFGSLTPVIRRTGWIPAYAGMTTRSSDLLVAAPIRHLPRLGS
jgi:hypothetical protein